MAALAATSPFAGVWKVTLAPVGTWAPWDPEFYYLAFDAYSMAGACDPGFTDNLVTNSSGPDEWGFYSSTKTARRYTLRTNPGDSFTITCTPTASASATEFLAGSCNVSWKVEAWAVDITVGGTTPDPSDSDRKKILPEQEMVASVVYGMNAPLAPVMQPDTNPPVHDTTWSVTGCNPFRDYEVAMDQSSAKVLGYETVVGATTRAYWSKPGTGTVSCTHKMKLTESPYTEYTVSLEKQVPVVDLDVKAKTITPMPPGAFSQEYTDGSQTFREVGFNHMKFTGRFGTPSYFYVGADTGMWDFAQTFRSTQRFFWYQGFKVGLQQNFVGSPDRLDNEFPAAFGGLADARAEGETTDKPGFSVPSITGLEKLEMNDAFTMFWVYLPPRVEGFDVKYVAVWKVDWSVGVMAEAPGWAAFGTSPDIGDFVEWPKQPEWEGIFVNVPGG